MIEYIKDKEHGFLGESSDSAKHPFCAFKINEEIHIVYDIGTPEEYSTKAKISTIYQDPHKYLWTPYAQYV